MRATFGAAVAGLALLLAAPVVTGCAATYGGAATAAVTHDLSRVPYNMTDVLFCREMILHYRQSITMARLVPGRGDDPYVRGLAERITKDDAARIDVMAAFLKAWEFTVPDADNPPDHQMPGMPSPARLVLLKGRSGSAFDRLWLTTVARHTEYGTRLADKAHDEGKDRKVTRLAREIATAHETRLAEIIAHLA